MSTMKVFLLKTYTKVEDGAAELIENNNKLGSLEETIKVTQLASLKVKSRTEKD